MKKTIAFLAAFLIAASSAEYSCIMAESEEIMSEESVTEAEQADETEIDIVHFSDMDIVPSDSENAVRETEEEKSERERKELIGAYVDRLYRLVLGRNADPSGFSSWTEKLSNGSSSAAEVAYGFVFSNEYRNKNKSNEDYVEMLYNVMMNRGSDPQGKSGWLKHLSNMMSREYIFWNFINSAEFSAICGSYRIVRGNITLTENRDVNPNVTAYVYRLYSLCLGRIPDKDGLNNWCRVLNSKELDAANAVKGFVFSNEFKNMNKSDEDFVEVMYRVLLDRASDTQGKNNWVSAIRNGYSRLAVLKGFVGSDEFSGICREYGIERGNIEFGGWSKDSSGFSVYTLPDKGCLATGYKNIDGVNYYFDNDGRMRTNWSRLVSYVNTSSALYSYNDMVNDITGLQQQYPSLVRIESLGVTADKRQIYDMVIGRSDAPKQMVIQAGCHAREYMGCMLVMNQAEELLSHYWSGSYAGKSYKDLLDQYQIHIIPMLNPDGVTLTQYGLNGINSADLRSGIMEIYRKDISEGVTSLGLDAYLRGWKANARGVDINRNFSTPDWADQGEIPRPSCAKYAGPFAASEAETNAVSRLVESLGNCRAVISYHSSGSMIYWSYHQSGDFRNQCYSIANDLKNMTGYYLVPGVSDGGGCSNWVVDVKKITGFTIEIGSGDSPLPLSQYAGIWRANRNVVPYLLSALG